MWKKIKSKKLVSLLIYFILIFLLFFTRIFGIDWGLPYPMHPDERNMAVAITQLKCQSLDLNNCFHPHFFAYGQLPLYLGYGLIFLYKLITSQISILDFGRMVVDFNEAILSLRFISVLSSIFTAILILEILKIVIKKEVDWYYLLLIIFSPFAIQYAHYGTTEALLMFFYSYLTYLSLKVINGKIDDLSYSINSSLLIGLALATKISSAIFFIIPVLVIFIRKTGFRVFTFYETILKLFDLFILFFLSILFFIFFSPHNFLHWNEFLSSFDYESKIGLGKINVFYTQQFFGSLPIIFQLIKIIPFAVGLIGLVGLIGFIVKKTDERLLFLAFLVYFLPNAVVFAKWTRFIAPAFPILLILGIIFLEKIKIIKMIKALLVVILSLHGAVFFLNYLQPDIRFQASEWIFKNIPENAYILSETANVVDLPLVYKEKIYKNYRYVSFNFYDLDSSQQLQKELEEHLKKADYIIVPSRRIFANYTCLWPDNKSNFIDKFVYQKDRCEKLKKQYPLLNEYYEKLFNGQLGFRLIKTFQPFSSAIFFNDEVAEETWSVFDHPTVRIYKRI